MTFNHKSIPVRGECVHIRLGQELGQMFNEYCDFTGLAKSLVLKTLLRRFLDARTQNEKTISIQLY